MRKMGIAASPQAVIPRSEATRDLQLRGKSMDSMALHRLAMHRTAPAFAGMRRWLRLRRACTNCGSLVAALLGMTGRMIAIPLLLLLALSSPLAGQDAVPALTPEQARAAETAMTRLRSPFTPAHTVDMCPSAPALRDSIRVAAASGMSADELVEDVIARHGEHLRMLPKRSGAGLLAWLATPLLLLIGGGLIVARLRRDGAGAGVVPTPADRISDDERERLAAAMRSFEDTGGIEP